MSLNSQVKQRNNVHSNSLYRQEEVLYQSQEQRDGPPASSRFDALSTAGFVQGIFADGEEILTHGQYTPVNMSMMSKVTDRTEKWKVLNADLFDMRLSMQANELAAFKPKSSRIGIIQNHSLTAGRKTFSRDLGNQEIKKDKVFNQPSVLKSPASNQVELKHATKRESAKAMSQTEPTEDNSFVSGSHMLAEFQYQLDSGQKSLEMIKKQQTSTGKKRSRNVSKTLIHL